MELCTARGISNLLLRKPPPHIAPCLIQCRPPFPAHLKQTRSPSDDDDSGTIFLVTGFSVAIARRPRYTIVSCLSSTTEASTYEDASPDDTTTVTTLPEDTLSEAAETKPMEDTAPEIAMTEATSDIKDEPESDSAITAQLVDSVPVEKEETYIYHPDVVPVPQEDDPFQLLKFLEDLNIKFDFEDKNAIVALGVGGLIAIRIAVAVIGAIDSIPLLPKLLELVGLGYTIWFTTRYLIFEQNREEFVARVKQLKEEVIG